jgi:hypothetical protein
MPAEQKDGRGLILEIKRQKEHASVSIDVLSDDPVLYRCIPFPCPRLCELLPRPIERPSAHWDGLCSQAFWGQGTLCGRIGFLKVTKACSSSTVN